MKNLQSWWEEQTSEVRQKTLWGGGLTAILLIVLFVYYSSGEADRRAEPVKVVEKRELNLGRDLLQDDIQEKVKTDIQEQNLLIGNQNSRLEQLERNQQFKEDELKRVLAEYKASLEEDGIDGGGNFDSAQNFPQPPSYKPPEGFQGYESSIENVPDVAEIIGDVGHSSGEPFTEKKTQKNDENTFYLAPGFMQAMTLHGIEALTTEGALANPEPIMIRVQAPAVLPNNIKAHLSGCFVMGNATGSLAKERIQVQVVNLSCLSPDGSAVIDQEVLGYVVDSDGKKDLQANIVTKMDQHVWRSFLAGAASGIGDGLSGSSSQTQVTSGGLIQTFDPDELASSALGSGLKGATDDIKDIFLDLAKQTAPVAEAGGAKKIQVVIQQGVELKIRKRSTYKN